MNIKSFTIYREYYDLISILPTKEQANLSLAILQYIFEDIEPVLSKQAEAVFVNLKRPLDKSKSKSNNSSKKKQNEIKIKSNSNQNENETITHQDVYVNVNNHDNDYVVNVDVNSNLFDFIESNFKRTLNSVEYEVINDWKDNELTRYAIKQAILNQVFNIKYIDTILKNYELKGITTIEQAEKDNEKFKENKKNNAGFKRTAPEWAGKEVKEEYLTDEELAKLEEKLKGV